MDRPLLAESDGFETANKQLFAFVFGLVRDWHAAQDITQETWIRVSEQVQRGQEIANIGAWSRGVARNLILHFWRRRRTGRLVFSEKLIDLAEQAFTEYETAEPPDTRLDALRACMNLIAVERRELLRLRYECQLSFNDMAARLKKSVSSLTVQMHRLREWLKDCITKRQRRNGGKA